jgi:hypothetical protein
MARICGLKNGEKLKPCTAETKCRDRRFKYR